MIEGVLQFKLVPQVPMAQHYRWLQICRCKEQLCGPTKEKNLLDSRL